MEERRSPEQRVRIKIGLILLIVILYFAGLFIYSYSLKNNMDLRKKEMDNSYKVLSRSNQLIVSIQEAQDVLNMYLASPRRALQQQYDSISEDISLQIMNIKGMKPETDQDILLQDIDSLLHEKNRIVRRLTGLFRSQNPLTELDEKINSYDELLQDSVIVTTSIDTIKVEKQKRGFWRRLRNVFDPHHAPDTTVNLRRIEQKSASSSRVDTVMYADLKTITEEASKTYSSRIQGIEREVRELLFAEQNISLHISHLTNEFYNETIQIAWDGTEDSEALTQKIFKFAILIGALSLLIIIIIIFYIIDDLNKGQKARLDLAKEKQFTEELIESRHKLLLSVSHDVKTPLSSMMGYMEIWDAEESDENKKRQLQSARSSGKHILNMLTNLLEFSRLQQKMGKLHYSIFNLVDLLDEIVGMFRPLTDEKGLDLQVNNHAVSPLYIETDHTVLTQILTNVVSNAVKYTAAGHITIEVQYKDRLIFTISDTGIGMDREELPDIFRPFSRMKNPLKSEGSGFGMYVTKGLVDLLQGEIDVVSEKGKGSCITITLPVTLAEESTTPLKENNSAQPINSDANRKDRLTILLFEDDLPLGRMISEYLIRDGHEVRLCSNPQDVNKFMNNLAHFDIIFSDMQMREITGADILRLVREKNMQIPVWLMTAHDDYTVSRAVAEGFSGFIRKPIPMDVLSKILIQQEKTTEERIEMKKEGDCFDFQETFPSLVALFGDSKDTIADILSGFLQSSRQDMERLEEFINNNSFEEAQQLCHKIHPFLSQLDADYLCVTLRKMDQLRGEDASAYPEWKDDLRKAVAAIRQFTSNISIRYGLE